MQTERARKIFQGLVNGIDPLTDTELPKDTILDNAEVVRALLVGIAALDAIALRESRRAVLPRNIGKAWNEQENSRLVEAFQAGIPLGEIATRHGRTLRAIEARLEKLNLITTDQRTTVDRFPSNAKDE